MPTLYVVIPVYNEAATAEQCVKLVVDAPLDEGLSKTLVIVDDHSDDEAAALLKSLVNPLVIISANTLVNPLVISLINPLVNDLVIPLVHHLVKEQFPLRTSANYIQFNKGKTLRGPLMMIHVTKAAPFFAFFLDPLAMIAARHPGAFFLNRLAFSD